MVGGALVTFSLFVAPLAAAASFPKRMQGIWADSPVTCATYKARSPELSRDAASQGDRVGLLFVGPGEVTGINPGSAIRRGRPIKRPADDRHLSTISTVRTFCGILPCGVMASLRLPLLEPAPPRSTGVAARYHRAAARLRVSVASASRWSTRHQQEGHVTPPIRRVGRPHPASP